MMDERTEAQASLYVLGALPSAEAHEFEAALRADPALQLLVRELRGTVGAMVAAFPQTTPPPALKQKILATIDERESGRPNLVPPDDGRAPSWLGWTPWALAACFAILCVLLVSIGQSLRQQAINLSQQLEEKNAYANDLQQRIDMLQARTDQQTTNYQTRLVEVQKQVLQRIEELNRQNATLTNQLHQKYADSQRRMIVFRDEAEKLRREKKVLQDALGMMESVDRFASAIVAVLRPTAGGPAGAVGASFWSTQDQRGMLSVEGLPPLPVNQSYQLWLIDPKLPPINAGVLPDVATGGLRVQFGAGLRVESAQRFAISIEPRGGSTTPTRVVMSSN